MSETYRNHWHRRAASQDLSHWPLVYDLGRDIGAGAWWRNLGLALAGPALALALGMITPEPAADSPAALSAAQAMADADAAPALASDTAPSPVAVLAAAENATPMARPPLLDAMTGTGTGATPPGARDSRSRRHVLRRNETLIEALIAAGSDRRDAYAAANALGQAIDARRLRPGLSLTLEFGPDADENALLRVSLRSDFDRMVTASRAPEGGAGYAIATETLPTNRLLDRRAGVIEDSLYLAARREGVPTDILVEMIRLFSFSVDFQRQIRPGDSFELLYDRRITEADGRIENGRILYARMTLRGKDMAYYRHEDTDGRVEYFSPDGRSARKALMKTPLDGARLTSHFGPRKHPVLGYVRAHQGVDFGAPSGTPVYAAGDGVIERASRYGSYGNYIRIRHNSTGYKTAYAHLSGYARGIRAGARVTQGQVIGYVGATGRVTAAHLHYEVYRGESRVNPLKLDLPSGRALEGPSRARFLEMAATLDQDRTALAHMVQITQAAAQPGATSEDKAQSIAAAPAP